MLGQSVGQESPEPGVIPVLDRRCDHPHCARRAAGGPQRGQGGEEEAAGEIARGSEQQQVADHVCYPANSRVG
jgi:hypothetical protein